MFSFQGMLSYPLTPQELEQLDQYFKQQVGLTLFHVHGLLCAMISGPRRVPSHDWLSAIGDNLPAFSSMPGIQVWMKLLLRLHNQIAHALLKDEQFFPLVDYQPVKHFAAKTLRVEQKHRLACWCQGYLDAVKLNQAAWIKESTEDEISHMLMPICSLSLQGASPEGIGHRVKEKSSPQKREAHIDQMIRLVPPSVLALYAFWRYEGCAQSAVLCPCGSGWLVENCCDCRGTLH